MQSAVATDLQHVITFDPAGGVAAMHLDHFSLGFLGSQDIARASDIRHNSETQQWDLYIAESHDKNPTYTLVEEAKGFPTYDSARQIEVQWLQNCRSMGYTPLSAPGLRILSLLRSS